MEILNYENKKNILDNSHTILYNNDVQDQKLEEAMDKRAIVVAILECEIGSAYFDHPVLNELTEVLSSDFPVRALARMTPLVLQNKCKSLSLEQARRIIVLAREEIREREKASKIPPED